jgi:BMFP domain-containing protein YqiC
MGKSVGTDFMSTLKSYAQKLSDGERTPAEIAAALNDWAHESAESVRSKVHEEVETAVLKMGFVKREEFDALAAEVASLKKKSAGKKSAPKKSSNKNSKAAKTILKKPLTKSTRKKKVAKI